MPNVSLTASGLGLGFGVQKRPIGFRVSGWFRVEASEGLEFGASKVWGVRICALVALATRI